MRKEINDSPLGYAFYAFEITTRLYFRVKGYTTNSRLTMCKVSTFFPMLNLLRGRMMWKTKDS